MIDKNFVKTVKRVNRHAKIMDIYKKILVGINNAGGRFGLWYLEKFMANDLRTIGNELGFDFDEVVDHFLRNKEGA